MPYRKLHAVVAQAEESRLLLLHRWHLPRERGEWIPILKGLLGDTGLGCGIAGIVGPPTAHADLDYIVIRLNPATGQLDDQTDCLEVAAATAPFAVEELLLENTRDGEVTVRLHHAVSGQVLHASFTACGGEAMPGGKDLDGAPVLLRIADSTIGSLPPTQIRTRRLLRGDAFYRVAHEACADFVRTQESDLT